MPADAEFSSNYRSPFHLRRINSFRGIVTRLDAKISSGDTSADDNSSEEIEEVGIKCSISVLYTNSSDVLRYFFIYFS
jgi:hypothetical protein